MARRHPARGVEEPRPRGHGGGHVKRSRARAAHSSRRVGLPPSASLSGEDIFVTDRGSRRRAPKHARSRWGAKRTEPLPAFVPHRSGPPKLTASARLDGADEVRRIEERRRFELDLITGPGTAPDTPGGDWARVG